MDTYTVKYMYVRLSFIVILVCYDVFFSKVNKFILPFVLFCSV